MFILLIVVSDANVLMDELYILKSLVCILVSTLFSKGDDRDTINSYFPI